MIHAETRVDDKLLIKNEFTFVHPAPKCWYGSKKQIGNEPLHNFRKVV